MPGWLKPYQAAQIKKKYPAGTRIQLEHMEGEPDMPDGLQGKVEFIDDQGQLHMKWNNGRSLAVAPLVDDFHILRTFTPTGAEKNDVQPMGISCEDEMER